MAPDCAADGSYQNHRLLDNRLYAAIVAVLNKAPLSKPQLDNLLLYNSEIQAINEALHSGVQLEDLVMSPHPCLPEPVTSKSPCPPPALQTGTLFETSPAKHQIPPGHPYSRRDAYFRNFLSRHPSLLHQGRKPGACCNPLLDIIQPIKCAACFIFF
ncbi:MAG: hypothetical protein IT260_15645 [Saprospiraceae bacterium]|nr:hypothetical protein [Saprospiraceae bacterium]